MLCRILLKSLDLAIKKIFDNKMELKPERKNKPKKEPEVSYEFTESEKGENELNLAFDILFDEVVQTQNSAKELSTS